MAFSDKVKQAAFRRSGGLCECRRKGHGHVGRCATRLTATSGEYHHITSVLAGGSDGLANCEYLCGPCHQKTRSYGRS
jgi:5-methylcytosine-specific restriction endonuclease McrA